MVDPLQQSSDVVEFLTAEPQAKSAPRFSRVSFIASNADEAQKAARRLSHVYGNAPAEEADVVVALGGDGLMLNALHRFMPKDVPIYGMNRGTVGFLMNHYREEGLLERLEASVPTVVRPLVMHVLDTEGHRHFARAVNEVSLYRQTFQAAKLEVWVDGTIRMKELAGDGALVATPAGSTAYNHSAYGPIVPLNSKLLALTPLNPFRPKRWRGALLPDHVEVRFGVLDPIKRPVSAVADHTEFRNAKEVVIRLDRDRKMVMLHDPEHGMEERIIAEQFAAAQLM
ncbi:NAD kinase [Terrihabitans rhizophilus]|uniref:NAD kinase n=1 Tax=Terrihabitans rhizophilus TaxID=3092662 RepID=A0ABU4RRW3_9HYPH|nr:NAD kinase [Terrihabitans sp. PJ23]MDX6807593.1 NAD kinase [Terrihabitans sp. PJ23]